MSESTPFSQLWAMVEATKPKDRTDEKKKLQQASKINALASVLNLVSQTPALKQGVKLAPTPDMVTPYVMKSYQQMNKEDVLQGREYAKNVIDLTRDETNYNIKQADKEQNRQDALDKEERVRANSNEQGALNRAAYSDRQQAGYVFSKEKTLQEKKDKKAEDAKKAADEADSKYVLVVKDDNAPDKSVGLNATAINTAWGVIRSNKQMTDELQISYPGLIENFITGTQVDSQTVHEAIMRYWPQIKDDPAVKAAVKGSGATAQRSNSTAPTINSDNNMNATSTPESTPTKIGEVDVFDVGRINPKTKKWELDNYSQNKVNKYNNAWAEIAQVFKDPYITIENPDGSKAKRPLTNKEIKNAFIALLQAIGMPDDMINKEWEENTSDNTSN